MDIYLTGATGVIGTAIRKEIKDVIPLVRKKTGFKNEIVTDFSEESLRKILGDADVVLHFAGSLDFENEQALKEINVELTRRVVNATPQNARIIYAGSIAVYGKQHMLEAVDEETPVKPDTAYAISKLEGEDIVLTHPDSISLRIAAVYAPSIPIFAKMLKLVKRRQLPILGDGNNRLAFVSADDVALAVKGALKAPPGIYVVSGEALEQKKIYEIAARNLGVKPPTLHVPVGVARIAGMLGLFPKEYISFLASDRKFDYSKAQKILKFKPRSIEEGIKELVEELKL